MTVVLLAMLTNLRTVPMVMMTMMRGAMLTMLQGAMLTMLRGAMLTTLRTVTQVMLTKVR
jgi:hypothetical protein